MRCSFAIKVNILRVRISSDCGAALPPFLFLASQILFNFSWSPRCTFLSPDTVIQSGCLGSYETSQLRSTYALSLEQDLESFAHSFGVDQRLKLQPRFRALGLGLPLIVKVRKFISLPERHQKGSL